MELSLIPIILLTLLVLFNPKPEPMSTVKSWQVKPSQVNVGKKHVQLQKKEGGNSVTLDKKKVFNDEKEYKTIFEYITKKNKSIKTRDAEKIAKYLVAYGKKNNIDPKFVAAVIARESSFNKKAVSKTGAKGLGQIKDFNHESLDIKDPFSIEQNISGTTVYLNRMLGRWKEKSTSARLALASYYEGPNAVKRAGGQYGDKTSRYVEDIMGLYQDIKDLRKKYR